MLQIRKVAQKLPSNFGTALGCIGFFFDIAQVIAHPKKIMHNQEHNLRPPEVEKKNHAQNLPTPPPMALSMSSSRLAGGRGGLSHGGDFDLVVILDNGESLWAILENTQYPGGDNIFFRKCRNPHTSGLTLIGG